RSVAGPMVDRKVLCKMAGLPGLGRGYRKSGRMRKWERLEMSKAGYVAVDWGTSSFRLWLVGRTGAVLEERRSPEGMMVASKLGFAAVLQSHLDAVGAGNDLPVVICGMAGARQGWVEAGYIDTPAQLASILARAVPVSGQSPGLPVPPGGAAPGPHG